MLAEHTFVNETLVSIFEPAGIVTPDETAGAPAVVVLGHDVWQRSFEGRNDVVGSTVMPDCRSLKPARSATGSGTGILTWSCQPRHWRA